MRKAFTAAIYVCIVIISLSSCKSGAVNLFKPASPHEQYQRKLTTAGLDKTAMGISWADAATQSILKPISIELPYQETGYFAAERIAAAAYRFEVKQGQKIKISLDKSSSKSLAIYVDLWEVESDGNLKLIKSADTIGSPLEFDADEQAKYVMRLQPELLASGSFTLQVSAGPSLDFPVGSINKPRIESFFGDGRDANSRKHEGIDIFAKFHTPVLAIANGTVTRVNENNLGGKVVWLRPNDKNYTLYYAHLDRQIATEGQLVKPGDTLGLMGNTGNARTTPPHLHFGIYTNHGAVNPLAYIKPESSALPKVAPASLSDLNQTFRTLRKVTLINTNSQSPKADQPLPASTIVYVNGAFKNYLKVALPDGTIGFLQNNNLVKLNVPLKKLKISVASAPGFDQPNAAAAVKTNYKLGTNVSLLGHFSTYSLVSDDSKETSWISSAAL
jgi:murein DD-endopeptidase MepM/ murein hydrolase activator NlpD